MIYTSYTTFDHNSNGQYARIIITRNNYFLTVLYAENLLIPRVVTVIELFVHKMFVHSNPGQGLQDLRAVHQAALQELELDQELMEAD